jgi:hypothetical protein
MSIINRHHQKVFHAVLVLVLLSGGLFTAIFLVDMPTPGKQASAKASEKLTIIPGDYRQEVVSQSDQERALKKLEDVDLKSFDKLDQDLSSDDIAGLILALNELETEGEITTKERVLIEESISSQIK